jgi:choline dehydrogenase
MAARARLGTVERPTRTKLRSRGRLLDEDAWRYVTSTKSGGCRNSSFLRLNAATGCMPKLAYEDAAAYYAMQTYHPAVTQRCRDRIGNGSCRPLIKGVASPTRPSSLSPTGESTLMVHGRATRGSWTDIVVGAGSSGCALMARLAENPDRRVLLLEAGPDYPDPSLLPSELRHGNTPALFSHDWGWSVVDDHSRLVPLPRGKVVGGCSAVNTCIALRPEPDDFTGWARAGCSGWEWDNVLGHFRRLETDLDHGCGPFASHHGASGPLPIRRPQDQELTATSDAFLLACLAQGYPFVADLNSPGAYGVGKLPLAVLDDRRISAAEAYLRPIRRRPNVRIQPDTTVSRVVVRRGRAVGVEARNGAEVMTFRADRVHLCAGAIGTPTLLIRSGIGPQDQLQALGVPVVQPLAGVGEGLQDHSQCPVVLAAKADVIDPNRPCAQVLVRTGSGDYGPADLQFGVLNYVDLPAYSRELASLAGGRDAFLVCAMLQQPQGQGRVRCRSTNPDDAPLIEYSYVGHKADLNRYRKALRRVWELVQCPEFATVSDGVIGLDTATVRSDDDLDAYIRRRVQTAHHPAGTTRMGFATDPATVLDSRCQVLGVEALHVFDASIMPMIVQANTNLTCLMIGEMGADIVTESTENLIV